MSLVVNPYAYFTDGDGEPVTGNLYIGEAGKNAENFPIAVFYFNGIDTIPAPNPVPVSAGHIYNSGTASRLYVGLTSYSTMLKKTDGSLVSSFLIEESYPPPSMAEVDAIAAAIIATEQASAATISVANALAHKNTAGISAAAALSSETGANTAANSAANSAANALEYAEIASQKAEEIEGYVIPGGASYSISQIDDKLEVVESEHTIQEIKLTNFLSDIELGIIPLISDDILETALDLKANLTDVNSALDLKANLTSPTLTGTPTAPTPTAGDNSTKLATTEFVNSEISNDVGVANSSLVKTALNASGDTPIYACRAWVNFNGTGTVAIRASGNVSSITDNGTGDYTVNFATAMPDANYVMAGSGMEENGLNTGPTYQSAISLASFDAIFSTYVRILNANIDDDDNRDGAYITIAIFR
jgi:hypothetical protein